MTTETATDSRRKSTATRKKAPTRGAKPGERRGGRQPGTPNKITRDIRTVIGEMLEKAGPEMVGWLDKVAKKDPARALELALKAAEFAIPKLSRVGVTDETPRNLADAMKAARERVLACAPAVAEPSAFAKPAEPDSPARAKDMPPADTPPPPAPLRMRMPPDYDDDDDRDSRTGGDDKPYNPLN